MSRSAPLGVRPADLAPGATPSAAGSHDGVRSVLLRQSSKGDYKAVSGRGFAELGDVWLTGDQAAGLDRLTVSATTRTTAREALPSLVDRLGAPSALLMPVRPARIRTVLAVGVGRAAPPSSIGRQRSRPDLRPRSKWRRSNGRFPHRRLRELLLLFSRGISSTLNLATALETVAVEVTQMVGASAATVWLHDRRARELELTASSEPSVTGGARVRPTMRHIRRAKGLRLEIARRSSTASPRPAPGVASCAGRARPHRRGRQRAGRGAARRVRLRARPPAVGRHRERPAARGDPAAAPAARRHVQLARRSRRRHRSRLADRPGQRRVRLARGRRANRDHRAPAPRARRRRHALVGRDRGTRHRARTRGHAADRGRTSSAAPSC